MLPNTPARHKAVADAWRVILTSLGYDPDDPHMRETPDRVARFFSSWHTNEAQPPKLTTFENTEKYNQMVATGGITFHAMCAHHGAPFFGVAAVGYIPSDRVIGLSKMARVVDHFAHRFTTQERITEEVARYLGDELKPLGVGVVLRAEHLCMSMRGVCKPGHSTVTSAMRGALFNEPEARAELLALLR